MHDDPVRIEYVRSGEAAAHRIGSRRSRALAGPEGAAVVLHEYVERLAVDHGGAWRTLAAAYRPRDVAAVVDRNGAAVMADAFGGVWIITRDAWWEHHRSDPVSALRGLVRTGAVGIWDPARPVERLVANAPATRAERRRRAADSQLSLFGDDAAA